jgi:hypothetical protein
MAILVGRDAGSGDMFVKILFQIVMAGNLVLLAAFSWKRTRQRPPWTK